MKPHKLTSQRIQAIEAWLVRLKDSLTETVGSEPLIRRIAFTRSEVPAEMIWWRASGSSAVYIGVGHEEARSLSPSLSDLMSLSWGPGEITGAGPAATEVCDVWNVRFASGGDVRFFVSPEIAAAHSPGSNLEMLMEIELPLVIRFGRTQMALRDISVLGPGSVIGFERCVDEPVELLVNGHVVARGEAVTVNGSYGIRISEISSRTERLATSALTGGEQTI